MKPTFVETRVLCVPRYVFCSANACPLIAFRTLARRNALRLYVSVYGNGIGKKCRHYLRTVPK